MKIPTYEEFYDKVKYYFKCGWPRLNEEEVEEYLQSKSIKKMIDKRYKRSVDDIKIGKFTYEQIMIGEASSVGNCLDLMY